MSLTFLQLVLGVGSGLLLYNLAEALYYEIKDAVLRRQYDNFLEDFEENHWDD